MFNSNVYLSCEDKPTDLPKKATLPSVQTDTMSIAEEDFNMAARLVYFIAFESRLYKSPLSGDPSQATPRWVGTAASDSTLRPVSALRQCPLDPPGQARQWVCSGVWWTTSRGQRRRIRGQEATWRGWPANTPEGQIILTRTSSAHGFRIKCILCQLWLMWEILLPSYWPGNTLN